MISALSIDSRTREGFSDCEEPGCLQIAGRSFCLQSFGRISVGPCLPPRERIRLLDTEFRNCTVEPGEFSFRGGVELRRVEFDTVNSRDSLTISGDAALDHVVIRGRLKSGGLWIRPDEAIDSTKQEVRKRWADAMSESIALHVDFSELDCRNVEVIGLPIHKLRFNPERHVAVRFEWLKSVDVSRLQRSGFVHSSLRRLKTFGASEGVFAAPQRSSEAYAGFLRDAESLGDVGIQVFPG
jgi:hypothetical protein